MATTTVKSPNLSQSSSREATTTAGAARQAASQQRPRGASAFNAPLSDLDLAAATYSPSPPSQSAGSNNEKQAAEYTYQTGSTSATPSPPLRRPGSLLRLLQGQDTAGARRPASSTEALRRGGAQQAATISNTHVHPLSPTVVDPTDLMSWGDTATQAPQLPPPLLPLSTQSSKFSFISVDELSGGPALQSSQPSVALMNSSLNDPDSSSPHGRGRRATAPADAIVQHRPKSPPKGKPSARTKSRESLGSPTAWNEPVIPSSLNHSATTNAPAFPTFPASPLASSFNGAPSNQFSQALGAASLASVGTASTGSSRDRDRSRSHSPAREFVRNYLKTTTPGSVTPTNTNTSPSVQRLMAMTSTVAQTIRANVASAVNASGAAGATSSGLASAATTMLLGASFGGNNNAMHQAGGGDGSPGRKQSVVHDRHLLDTSVPDGLGNRNKNASHPSLKPSFSTSSASTDTTNRHLSSSHLNETLTPATPLAMRRLSCAAPKDKILPSDWPARTDQLALTMDMLLQDTRAIVGEINTSLEAAEQDNLAVGVKLATARTRLRSLVAWEATSTQAVVGWLNMAVSRHRQIERDVKDWGSRPVSPRRGLLGEEVVEEIGLVDSGQCGMESSTKTFDEHDKGGGRQAETTAAFELFDQTMTPSDFSLASRSSPSHSLNGSGNSAAVGPSPQ